MRRFFVAAIIWLGFTTLAIAQLQFQTVPSCGGLALPVNQLGTGYMDLTGNICTNAGGGGGGGGVVTQPTPSLLNATVVGTGGAALATHTDAVNIQSAINTPLIAQSTLGVNIGAVEPLPNVPVAACTGTTAIVTGGVHVRVCNASATVHQITICNTDTLHPIGGEDVWINIIGGNAAANTVGSFRLPAPTPTSVACRGLPMGFNGNVDFVAATSLHFLYTDVW